MLGWALRILLIILIVRAVMALVRGLMRGVMEAASVPGGDGGDRRHTARPTRGTLVQDPVCGTFVVRDRALSTHSGGATHYFCSEDCRRAHAARSA